MKTIAFVDYENIWTGLFEQGYELTPEILMESIQLYAKRNHYVLSAIYLYANFDREEFWRTQTSFEKTHVYTRHVYGKNNFASTGLRRNAADVELILEAQEILLTRTTTFDVFLLLTGDGDFLPLVRKIRAWGKEVKVIGVDGSIHHELQPFSDSEDFFSELLTQERPREYKAEKDLEQGVLILAQLQSSMAYVASTKARTALSEHLGATTSQVKDLIRHALKEGILLEQEYADSGLKIGKTKIYLLNLDHSMVQAVLGSTIEEIHKRYEKLGVL
ncbi:MAG TPA: NYN domain-containing protein [Desulfitobacterium dehalogenans]|uniref:NYN domain-containing protein n=1 Tax=Desulfitobacterium dehalogenans TaxID=36854 RepID=A0A7C7D3F3_9FIRM|nr:NYN domain-containing protein [Desulfitobacterium dehalogenans]